jgi:histidine ammonia-lyase
MIGRYTDAGRCISELFFVHLEHIFSSYVMTNLILDGKSLRIEDVYRAAATRTSVSFAPSAKKRIKASRDLIEEWVSGNEVVYGVTTGFGEFSNVNISRDRLEELQENLITSHSAGTGEPMPPEVVRAMMILRLNALAKGYSGIRLETMEFIRKAFNAGITPIIPSQGSVGSSGDLVQLAHLVLTMMGKGKVWYDNAVMEGGLALKRIGLKPLKLKAKEGLALVNGTQMMTAYAALAVHQARQLCKLADIAAAMSVEALKGSDTAFDARIQALRPHAGQAETAANLRMLMRESEIRESHRHGDPRVQDAYSIRCIPQVHGASRDAIRYTYETVSTEINSATDNPLIFPEEKIHLEGGNFHGQPVALVLDFLAIALSELANISERRIERMVNGALSGLPRFLTEDGGLNSGLMIAQYTAASLVSENKVLSHPASVDSIPTSANQEDHNSMGSIGALKVWHVLHNVQTVIAIELMVAAQGVDFSRVDTKTKRIMKAGKGVQAAHSILRKSIAHLGRDRALYDDIQTSLRLVKEGTILAAVEKAVGKLK